jgi:hypothetical protein
MLEAARTWRAGAHLQQGLRVAVPAEDGLDEALLVRQLPQLRVCICMVLLGEAGVGSGVG